MLNLKGYLSLWLLKPHQKGKCNFKRGTLLVFSDFPAIILSTFELYYLRTHPLLLCNLNGSNLLGHY